MSSAEQVGRKRFKREDGSEQPRKTQQEINYADFGAIPLATSIISKTLLKDAQRAWVKGRQEASGVVQSQQNTANSSKVVIPPHKVGALELYKRFPDAYDALMSRHNCTAVRDFLVHTVLARIVASSVAEDGAPLMPPSSSLSTSLPGAAIASTHGHTRFVRVADFGCGTGRIEGMVVQHPSVRAVYGYDSETPMLKRCLVNTARSAGRAGHWGGISVVPRASADHDRHHHPAKDDSLLVVDSGMHSASDVGERGLLEMCVRPCPFQSIQAGFLGSTHHPKCQLVVCAWSLSYVMRLQWGESRWHAAVDTVIAEFVALLDTSASDAALVIIETLGNGTPEPTRQNTLVERLESHFGFERQWVRTDYEFDSVEEATAMTRFFFGEKMSQKMSTEHTKVLIECTGMWILWKRKDE